jgi:hypothetical protein
LSQSLCHFIKLPSLNSLVTVLFGILLYISYHIPYHTISYIISYHIIYTGKYVLITFRLFFV